MQETLIKIINEKLNAEEIEKKITTIVEKGITDAIQELFLWKGPLREEIQKINFLETNIKDDFVEGTEIHYFLQQSLYDIEFKNNEFETLLNNKFEFKEDIYYSLAVLEDKNGRIEERLTIVKKEEQPYPFITSDANAIFNTLYYILELLHKEEEENKNEKLSR